MYNQRYITRHRDWDTGAIDVRVEQGYEIDCPSPCLLCAQDSGDTPSVKRRVQVLRFARGALG
ncbi:MAG: hypothetical protein HY741_16335 [Chloroflexi bacterium]|nr:hypothetical protein [Chloroflexota bacterium]